MATPPKDFAAYDLHLHTCWSYDATTPIEDYFRRARELNLRGIAITEHHTIDSFQEIREIAPRYPEVRWIPAAELTVTTSIGSVDLLCYNLPLEPSGALQCVLDDYHQWQRDLGAALSRGMLALGYGYTDEQRHEVLRGYRPERVLRRQGITHVKGAIQTQAFIRHGYIRDSSAAPALLKEVRAANPLPPSPAVDKVTAAVKDAGGLIVIAHPPAYFQGTDRARMDLLRAECRLDGIECAHRKIAPELTPVYRAYCLEHDLFSTGGSDCHEAGDIRKAQSGGYTPQRRFACHLGEEAWFDEFLARCSLKQV